MLYKFHYGGPVLVNGYGMNISCYTVAKSERKAIMNIKWRLHKETGVNVALIQVDLNCLTMVEHMPDIDKTATQLTLFDLYPEVMKGATK